MKYLLNTIRLAAVFVTSLSYLQGADDASTKVATMPRAELDAKVATAKGREKSIDRIRELVELVRFSYSVTAAEFNSSNESRSVMTYVPAITALTDMQNDHKLIVDIVLEVLPTVSDDYYRRRLVFVVEYIHDKPINRVVKEGVSAEQLKVYMASSSFGKPHTLTFFIQAVATEEEKRLEELLNKRK